MNLDMIDWMALERLRTAYLEGTAGAQDYWRSESDLASYDATFAQRIGWKWDYVLNELQRRGWSSPAGELMDWGCGSGIAGRAFLAQHGANSVTGLRLWDRSALAMEFATQKARTKYPALTVQSGVESNAESGVLLVSHVLTELNETQIGELLALAGKATAVIWVEPGTREASRALIALREKLVGQFHVVAPCTHQAACGMLAANERHWCHHFAPSPTEVFMDAQWARFAAMAGVDLRSLPVSFLVLDKRPVPALPKGATRIIGRPRVYKAHALVFGCDETGVHDRRLTKRALPEQFRAAKKDTIDPLQVWRCEGEEIKEAKKLFGGGSAE